MVLFSAQQFRSQVHKRVVGNAGTALYGRMDGDELATPGYAVLSPAVRTKLSTLTKGQLMVRHPHFTQPVFVHFPRPSVLTGRLGVERFPAVPVEDFDAAMLRRLRRLDSGLTLDWLRTVTALAEESEVIRAVRATEREQPREAKGYFASQFRRQVAPRELAAPHPVVQPLALPVGDDPYGF
jgi:DNA helicase HerA-like ATPase